MRLPLILVLCALALSATAQTSRLANPASTNCQRQGGTPAIERRGDGGEFGLCRFEQGRACEEWALFRLECPVGGIDLAPYATPEARYCVARGGILSLPAGVTDEGQGTCHLPESGTCPVGQLFQGRCG